MTTKEAEALRIGDAVISRNDGVHHGKVIERNWAAVRIRWDDGLVSLHRNEEMVLIASLRAPTGGKDGSNDR